ncbi:MAG: ABC transporter ATP-binding protein [Chloroflexi bacterium]|nr:ABC transporter ATP-binding protein [Anaerolineaceae bacterium]NMB89085.1 ABC transporter ATP-binding protein [Chloroflexota bacterium]
MDGILFKQVTKRYPHAERPAVNDVSIEVPAGSFVVLLGPSGCGKTTLLKMVNRLYEPTSGAIYLNGVDIRQMQANVLRRQIGYVIQQVGLFPHMTVAENIAVVPELLHWSRTQIDARIDELLTLVHLPPGEYRARYPSQLSGGQQQRVGLARALAVDPAVMLMDEPFGAIDAINRSNLQQEMIALQNSLHKTVLFVTHDVDEALRLADRIVVMREGRVVQYASPCDLLSHPVDEFVRQLLDTDDRIRQLSLMRADSVMAPIGPAPQVEDQPTINAEDHLRQALSLLLQPGIRAVTVMQDGQPVGRLTLEQVQRAGCEGE